MKARVTVIFPVTFEIEFDKSKAKNEGYVEAKQNEVKDLASHFLQQGSVTPVIHESNVDALVE